MPETIRAYAPLYQNLGFYLFPTFGKYPPKDFPWREMSSRDPVQWSEWEQEFSGCNWAIDCGKSGLIVWDIDSYKEGSEEAWQAIPGWNANVISRTKSAKTPKGGRHYYFKGPPMASSNGILPGVDVKSEGGYVVLPPSKDYTWIGQNDISDYPAFLANFHKPKLAKEKEKLQVPDPIRKGKRDETLFKEACSLLAQGHDESFVLEVLHKTNMEKCEPPLSYAQVERKLISALDQIKKNEDTNKKKQREEKKAKKREYEYFKKNLFELDYPERRFCPIKQNLFVKAKSGHWDRAVGKEKFFRSRCLDLGLSPAPVVDHLERWASQEENFNTEENLLIDVPKWDGKDRIGYFLKALNVTNMSHQYAYELLCHWLVGIWRRIENPKERNWVLVLHGPQAIGKDWWIREFLGAWNSRYYFETLNVFSDEIRTFMHLDGKVVIHLSEFDEAKKWSSGFLKDLITKESLSYIGKYQSEVRRIEARHSLVASANRLDFLTDTSGSSRFFILDTKKIFFDYPQNQSMQILAQSHDLFKKGYEASQDALKSLESEQDRVTPPDIDLLIIQEFKFALEGLEQMRAQNSGCSVSNLDLDAKRFTHEDLEDVWKILCEKYRKSRKSIIGIVKPIYGRRDMKKRFFTLETH
jgi:hypothetical protein